MRCFLTFLLMCVMVPFGLTQTNIRSLLTYNWYEIEVIVFEPAIQVETTEWLTHYTDFRILPRGIQSMQFSESEMFHLSRNTFRQRLIRPKESTEPSRGETADEDFSDAMNEDCWFHPSIIEFLQSPSLVGEHEELSDPPQRNPVLPDWLPDDWQTLDVNLREMAQILGICDEDLTMILDEAFLDFIRDPVTVMDQSTDVEEIDHTALDRKQVEEFETELEQRSFTHDPDRIRLQTIANRLQAADYKLIDHQAWFQHVPERGNEEKLLVQFGDFTERSLREVEGTLTVSVARFLHVDVDLWHVAPIPEEYEPEDDETELPIFFHKMDESRRVTLGDLHYFDHPRFGIIVQLRRLAIPQDIQQLLENLSRSE